MFVLISSKTLFCISFRSKKNEEESSKTLPLIYKSIKLKCHHFCQTVTPYELVDRFWYSQ